MLPMHVIPCACNTTAPGIGITWEPQALCNERLVRDIAPLHQTALCVAEVFMMYGAGSMALFQEGGQHALTPKHALPAKRCGASEAV